jgi:hypothetical protein
VKLSLFYRADLCTNLTTLNIDEYMEYYTATAKQLYVELEQLQYSVSDHSNRANRAIHLIRNTLKLFRISVCTKGFLSQEDEIRFFKHVKPQVHSYLIFYTHLYEIESKKLVLSSDQMKGYIDRKRKDFRYQTYDNLEFVNYYRSGSTHQDKVYFLRESDYSPLNQQSSVAFRDPEFTAPYDHIASVVLAYELFLKYLEPSHKIQDDSIDKLLKWTDSKASLVELIYALNESGAINDGKTDIKTICAEFERIFNFELKDVYSTYRDISLRKTNRTKFLTKLSDALEDRVLRADEY